MMLAMGLPGGFGAKNKTSRSQIRGAAAGALANNEQTPQKSTAQKALLISSLKISSDQVNGLQAKSDNYGQKPQDRVESETTREVEITDDDNSSVYSNDDETIPNNSCQLTSHSRAVTGMALDPACSRLLTSSRDYSVKFWDFHSMTSTLHPFFSFEPSETNPVRSMNYNLNGSLFLCCSTAQAKLYSRDGEEMCEYARGDPYLRDLRHTKGHTSSINRCMFHPYDRAEFMTCASDSTVRLWNVEVKDTQRDVICVKSKKGVNGRCLITAASYSRDGKNIAAAGDDGVLRIWNSKGPYIIPTMQLEKAHTSGSPITSLQFSSNHQEFITKCMDDTVKLWDIRNFKGPVATKTGVTSFYEESNAIYSPYERFVVCGISGRKDSQPQQGKRDTLKTAPQMNPADSNPGDNGGLLFLDAKTLELHERREMNGGVSAVTLMWSDPISQLFVGCGDGSVQIMYDPDKSTGGIVLPLSKSRKKLAVDDYEVVVYIYYLMQGSCVRCSSRRFYRGY